MEHLSFHTKTSAEKIGTWYFNYIKVRGLKTIDQIVVNFIRIGAHRLLTKIQSDFFY